MLSLVRRSQALWGRLILIQMATARAFNTEFKIAAFGQFAVTLAATDRVNHGKHFVSDKYPAKLLALLRESSSLGLACSISCWSAVRVDVDAPTRSLFSDLLVTRPRTGQRFTYIYSAIRWLSFWRGANTEVGTAKNQVTAVLPRSAKGLMRWQIIMFSVGSRSRLPSFQPIRIFQQRPNTDGHAALNSKA